MKKWQRRMVQLYGLMLASAALGRPAMPGDGAAFACANCNSPILCEGGQWTGYRTCKIVGTNPCTVGLPVCEGGS